MSPTRIKTFRFFQVSANPLAQLLLTNPNVQNAFHNIPPALQPQANNFNPYGMPIPIQNPINNCYCKEPGFVRNQVSNQVVPAINNNNGNQQNLNKYLNNPMFQMLLDPKKNVCNQNGNIKQNKPSNTVKASNQVTPNNIAPQQNMNRMNGNPILQMILDPKTKVYNQNGVEIPSQTILPNTGTAPNIVNNYYILTSECLAEDEIFNEKDRNTQKARKNESRRNKSEERGNSNREGKRQSSNRRRSKKRNRNDGRSGKDDFQEDVDSQQRDPHIEHINNDKCIENMSNENTKDKTTCKTNGDKIETVIKDETVKESSPSNGRRGRKKTGKRQKNCDGNKEVILIPEEISVNSQPSNNPNKPLNREDNMHENRKPKRKNKYDESSKDEAVIQDIHRKFPGMSEDVIRNLLHYLKRHLKNRELSNTFQECDSPVKNDRIAPHLNLNQRNSDGHDGKRNNNRRMDQKKPNNSRREENESMEQTLANPATYLSLTATTEKNVDTKIKEQKTTQQPLENIDTEKNRKVTEYPAVVTNANHGSEIGRTPLITIEETTKASTYDKLFPNLGDEDVIHIFPENLVDDYYPDFRADNMYYETDEDYIRNHRDNRYTKYRNAKLNKNIKKLDETTEYHFELTDRKGTTTDHNKKIETFSLKIPETISNETDNWVYIDSITKTPIVEEIEFQTPPLLEHPDFETKPIRTAFEVDDFHKVSKTKNENLAKSSTYSNAKHIENPSKTSLKNEKIETIFAKSKVVKYGHSDHFSEEAYDSGDASWRYDDTVFVNGNPDYEYW